ncbi:MAG: LuxR C-terminal-related transcriptional regulator [Mycobacteriales bacterium]
MLYDSSPLLAGALAYELRRRGHDVHLARRSSELVGLALELVPDVVVVGDLLERVDARPVATELAKGVPVPVIAIAGHESTAGERGQRRSGVVGTGRSLMAVVRAIEDAGQGKAVHEPDALANPRRNRPSLLTVREREVVSLLADGASTSGIATGLGVSASTARTYVQQVLRKLDAHSRAEAVAVASLQGVRPVRPPVQRDRRHSAHHGPST